MGVAKCHFPYHCLYYYASADMNHCPNHSVEGIGLGEDNLKIVV